MSDFSDIVVAHMNQVTEKVIEIYERAIKLYIPPDIDNESVEEQQYIRDNIEIRIGTDMVEWLFHKGEKVGYFDIHMDNCIMKIEYREVIE